MKKRILALMLIGVMAFTACGNKNTEETTTDQVEDTAEDAEEETEDDTADEESTEADVPVTDDTVEDLGIDAFLTAGDYKGIEVAKADVTVADEDVDAQIETNLSSYPLIITDDKAGYTVETGDTVNLDYSGSMDGVVFEGGTYAGYDLVIGSGSFIDDFEDQLVGMHVGEEGEVEVTFPDPYENNPDYAGKDAVFSVKINQIQRTLTEVTDEWLEANADGKTLEEYRQSVKEDMEYSNLSSAAWAEFCNSVEFIQFPQDRIDTCLGELEAMYETYAYYYGMEYDEFLEACEITEDILLDDAKDMVRNWLALDYVCTKEGVTEDSDTYLECQQVILDGLGVTTLEEAAAYGYSAWNMDYSTKCQFVIDFIADNAVLTEAE